MYTLSNSVRIPVTVTTYIDINVESDKKELALLEAGYKLNEMNIATINQEIIQNDGTVHMVRADDWKIGDYEFNTEED